MMGSMEHDDTDMTSAEFEQAFAEGTPVAMAVSAQMAWSEGEGFSEQAAVPQSVASASFFVSVDHPLLSVNKPQSAELADAS